LGKLYKKTKDIDLYPDTSIKQEKVLGLQ